jgi:hypothetical protein
MMARRTVELFECDICTDAGDRYTIQFPDGSLALDRCIEHADEILRLKDGPGQWTPGVGGGKTSFRISTPAEIERLKNASNQ